MRKKAFQGMHPIVPLSKRAREKTLMARLPLSDFDEFEMVELNTADQGLIDRIIKNHYDFDRRILIHVNSEGTPRIADGEHRIAIMRAKGVEYLIPTTVYFFGEPRNWLPKSIRAVKEDDNEQSEAAT